MLYMIASLNVAENMLLEGPRQHYQTKCTISTPHRKEKGKKLGYIWWEHVRFVSPFQLQCTYAHFLLYFFSCQPP